MKIIRTDEYGVEIVQGTPEWKALRVGLLTGTGIGNILPGKKGGYLASRDTELRSIVVERLTGKGDSSFGSGKYMKDGVEREPFARMALEERFGYIVEEVAFVQHDWMKVGVSPDGLVIGQKRNVEIKCPKDTTHLEYLQLDTVPEIYVPQTQSQLWITGNEATDFASYHPDFPPELQLHVIQVERDEAYIAMIEAEVSKFLAEANLLEKKMRERAKSIRELNPAWFAEEMAA